MNNSFRISAGYILQCARKSGSVMVDRKKQGRKQSMGSLVEVIARALVSKPDEVKVTEETDGKEILVKLQVADEDIGKIIGKSGRIAKAIRTVVKAAAIKQNLRVTVEIVEE